MAGAAKMAEEMLKEAQDAAQQAEKLAQAEKTPEVEFREILQEHTQVQPGTEVGKVDGRNMADLLRAAREAQEVPRTPAIGQSLDRGPFVNGLQRVMQEVMNGQNKLEDIIQMSLSGETFSMQEMLAMQAGVYRFTQELELSSKVVEKGTSSIKQTMNTQV